MSYGQRHSDLEISRIEIRQIAGTLPRSQTIRGLVEAFLRSKKYAVPVAVLHLLIVSMAGGGLPGRDCVQPQPY